MRSLGYKCCAIFFDNTNNINIDPNNYGNVIQIKINNDFSLRNIVDRYNIKKFVYSYFNDFPTIIYSWNYGAPIISRSIFRYSKIIYVITGIPTITLGDNSCVNNNISINKVFKKGDKRQINYKLYNTENKCIQLSNYCLPYSKLIEKYFSFLY